MRARVPADRITYNAVLSACEKGLSSCLVAQWCPFTVLGLGVLGSLILKEHITRPKKGHPIYGYWATKWSQVQEESRVL